jgi:hypothetical protein
MKNGTMRLSFLRMPVGSLPCQIPLLHTRVLVLLLVELPQYVSIVSID